MPGGCARTRRVVIAPGFPLVQASLVERARWHDMVPIGHVFDGVGLERDQEGGLCVRARVFAVVARSSTMRLALMLSSVVGVFAGRTEGFALAF